MDRNNIGVPNFQVKLRQPCLRQAASPITQRWWQKPTAKCSGWTGNIRINTKLLSSEVSALWAKVFFFCASAKKVLEIEEKWDTMRQWQVHFLHFLTCPTVGRDACERLHCPDLRPSQLLWFRKSKLVQRRSPWGHFPVRLPMFHWLFAWARVNSNKKHIFQYCQFI